MEWLAIGAVFIILDQIDYTLGQKFSDFFLQV